VGGEFLAPFAGTARIRSGDETPFGEAIDVFLIPADIDPRCGSVAFSGGDGEFGQPVRNASGVVEAPDPSADAVRAALQELLLSKAADLEQQLGVLIAVIVDRERLTL